MKWPLPLLLVVLVACSRVTPENYAKIQEGMSEQEVAAVLGSPDESTSRDVLGISGTTSVWKARDAAITVRFVNGKVVLKSFEKPTGPSADRPAR